MTADDTHACAHIFDTALARLRTDLGLAPSDDAQGSAASRISYLVNSDPDDSVVAATGDTIVGFAQATHRDNCWTLAHLFVDPGHQSAGVGQALLSLLHDRSTDVPIGLIGSTADPRAMRAYASLPGFSLHPTVRAEGVVASPPQRSARVVDSIDLIDEAGEIDIAVRGSKRTADLAHLLTEGYDLRSIPGHGYAVANNTSIAVVAATSEEVARELLSDTLARCAHAELELPRMAANQQWAISVVTSAGLRLRPWGPLMVRGLEQPPAPYLPHPALC